MTGKLTLSILAAAALTFGAAAKEVKLLTIGNSFADSAFKFLPKVAESAGDKVIMDRANIGGCPLDKHWKLVEKSEQDPAVKPYYRKYTLRDKLEAQKWDFVTIQQASHLSWKPESYMPYAKNLQEYVKKYAPQAELVIQQTWAYRFDDNRLKSWKMSQREMFDKLVDAYDQAAAGLGIRLIPTGEAVQLARETQPVKYVEYDREALKSLKYPDPLPSEAGSFAVGMSWGNRKNKATGENERYIYNDPAHLNDRGRYLQACVWYGFFFDKPTSEIKFVPEGITEEDAAFLRATAQKVLDARKK